MKIGVAIIAFNAITWIERVIRGLQGYADAIAIVEGPTHRMAFDAPHGKSTDGTIAVISRLYHKGIVTDSSYSPQGVKRGEPIFWSSKIAMRQRTIDMLRALDCDWLHVIDADEFYTPEGLAQIRTRLSDGRIEGLTLPFVHFWGDLAHVAKGGKWDMTHPRIFRLNPDTQYTSSHDRPNTGQRLDHLDVPVYHTGWLDTPAKIEGKLRYYQEREGGIDPATIVPFEGELPAILQGVNTEGLTSPPGKEGS